MNVAGYVRVSSDSQTENYSIPQQKEYIASYCKLKQWNLIKIYVDGGFTGANTNRPALQDLIDNLDSYDIVLVYKLDRLSRMQKDVLTLIDLMAEHDCKFVSIQENFDTTTPLGMAMIGIMAAFAQLERTTIKERMAIGRQGRTKKGLWRAGSNVPTGYDYIDGHLVIREDEAVQIRKIFELALQGWTINKIRTYMHEHYTNRYSSWAQTSAVSTCLRNKLYIGMLPSRTDNTVYKGEHEPIIDEETFYQVQRILDARTENYDQVHKHPFKARYLLTGITYCGQCGGHVSIVSGHGYAYYGCNHNTADPRQKMKPKCATANYNSKKLEKLIIDEVLMLSYDDNAIKALIKPRKETDHRKAINSLERQKSRLIDLYAVGGIDLDALSIKINELTERIATLKADKSQPPEITFDEAKKIFSNVKDIFSNGTIEQQRVLLSSLIKKIVLTGNDIEIHWRFE